MENEHIVEGLIALYKAKGVDLSYLLGDPVFQALPLKDRVIAVKKHAATLSAGASENLTPGEKAPIKMHAILTGAAGAGVGIALARKLATTGALGAPGSLKALALTTALPTLFGVGLGALAGHAETSNAIRARRNVVGALRDAAQEPSNTNAVGVLSANALRNVSGTNLANTLYSKATHSVTDRFVPSMTSWAESSHPAFQAYFALPKQTA